MWDLYTGSRGDDASVSPAQATPFKGLPQAYIEVNEFDCLRDEAVAYAKDLQDAGVDTLLNQTKGTIHGFELHWKSKYTQQIIRERIAYMQHQFNDSLLAR